MKPNFSQSLLLSTAYIFSTFFFWPFSFSVPAAVFTLAWKRAREAMSSQTGRSSGRWRPRPSPCVFWSTSTSPGARCVWLWWAKTCLAGMDPTVKLSPQRSPTSLDTRSLGSWHFDTWDGICCLFLEHKERHNAMASDLQQSFSANYMFRDLFLLFEYLIYVLMILEEAPLHSQTKCHINNRSGWGLVQTRQKILFCLLHCIEYFQINRLLIRLKSQAGPNNTSHVGLLE